MRLLNKDTLYSMFLPLLSGFFTSHYKPCRALKYQTQPGA